LIYLSELHNELNNHVEKGNTLLLHQQLLNWSRRPLEALETLPAQSEAERKIMLYERAMLAFDTAQCWERSIEVCKELANAFERILFDFPAATRILQQQAKYFDQISVSDRIFPAYYRVSYFGSGFGADLRGAEFVFRSGNGLYPEGVREFTDRVKEKFSEATVANTSDPPPDNIIQEQNDWQSEEPREGGIQYIQITTLTPSTEEEMNQLPNKFEGTEFPVPSKIMKYHNNNNIQVFSYTRMSKPHLEQAKEKEKTRNSIINTLNNSANKSKEEKNEFRDLWLIKSYLITSTSIPCLQRRVFVVDKKESLLCPIQNAVLAIQNKNIELRELIEQVRSSTEDKPKQMGPLSMSLTGVVDAAVAGGVEKYREAFFSGEYLSNNPDHGPFVEQFKAALSNQLTILKSGLQVFDTRCDRSLKPLSEHLSKTYAKMVTDLKQLLQ
jgi:dedicator of cytokinesis protein 3